MKVLLLFLVACTATAEPLPAQLQPTRVRVQQVDRTPVTRALKSSGLLQPKQEMALAFKIGGVLSGVYVDAGARVKKGQVLARLDPTEVAAGVQQARDAHAKAQRDYERAKTLHEQGGAATADLQNATTGLSVAQATLATAEFNQKHSVITAPDDGWIERKRGEVGEVVAPGQPVFQMSGRTRGWVVRVAVSDRDLPDLQVNQPASLSLNDETLRAHVSEIAHSASPLSGTFEVELALDDARPSLRAGLVAKTEITLPSAAKARVPLAALVRGKGTDADVFVLDGDHARRTPVKLLFMSGDSAAIAQALDGVVVTEGSSQLVDGAKVAVAP